MTKFIFVLPFVGLIAACDGSTSNSTAVGALAGAAVGAAVSNDDDNVKGAIVGAAVGAAAGNYIGKTQNGSCIYQRANGSRYSAACP